MGMTDRPEEPTDVPPLYIRERLKRMGMTGEVLSEKIGTTPATISRLLNGRRKMTLEWLYAIAKALGVPVAELFYPPVDDSGPEARLRAALIAYGVNKDDLGRAISAVRLFVNDEGVEQSSEDQYHGRSSPPIRHREDAPS